MVQLFLGYPFALSDVRSAVEAAAQGIASILVASDRLRGLPLLHKIEEMMAEADACLFDLTLHNPNVALELGIAHGKGHRYAVLYCTDEKLNPKPDRASSVFSDIEGWDSIRYKDRADLEEQLRRYLPEFVEHAIHRLSAAERLADSDASLFEEERGDFGDGL